MSQPAKHNNNPARGNVQDRVRPDPDKAKPALGRDNVPDGDKPDLVKVNVPDGDKPDLVKVNVPEVALAGATPTKVSV